MIPAHGVALHGGFAQQGQHKDLREMALEPKPTDPDYWQYMNANALRPILQKDQTKKNSAGEKWIENHPDRGEYKKLIQERIRTQYLRLAKSDPSQSKNAVQVKIAKNFKVCRPTVYNATKDLAAPKDLLK